MLLTIGLLAGGTRYTRLAYSALAFGVWDILYYAFLRIMCGWPRSLLDWDILFLLPLPWWGPVLAPVSIAVLMILWGTLATQVEDDARPATGLTRALWVLNWIGIAIALEVFMADSLRSVHQGVEAMTRVLPVSFDWPLFGVALALMATPVLHIGWQVLRRPQRRLNARRPLTLQTDPGTAMDGK
jgi:hypothetical protein